MNYEILSYITLSLILGMMIGFFIIKKRVLVFAILLTIILIALMIMKKVDFSYYKQLLGDIENIDFYTFIASLVILFITLLEMIIVIYKKRKNKNNDIEEEIENDNKELNIIFHMIKIDMAYFDDEKQVYVLNDHFKNSLNVNKYELSVSEFNSYMVPSDNTNDEMNLSYQFQLNTINGYEWFDKINYKGKTKNIIVIYKTEKKLNGNGLIGSYKDLEKAIQDLNKQNQEFGLVLTNIVSIRENNPVTKLSYLNENKEIKNKDFRDLIITKYITNILSGYLKDQVKVYRLANYEYAFLILSKRSYEMVERGFYNNTSEFINCDLMVEKDNVTVASKAGVVFSGYIKDKVDFKIINAAFDMLQMAVSANYKQSYVLYQSPEENRPNYKLKDIGIDLDNDLNDFLHKNNN